MKTITNKTKGPLVVHLPAGKKLFLSPGKSGQIADKAEDHPPVKKLIEADQVEVFDDDGGSGGGHDGSGGGRTRTTGRGGGTGMRRTGDR